jgi:hypothetical protein
VAAVGLPVCRRAKLLLAAVGYSSSLCYVAAVGLPVSRRAKNFVGRCGLFFRLLVSRCGLRGRCGPASLAAGLKTLLAAVGYSFVFCLAAVGYVAAVGLPVLRRAKHPGWLLHSNCNDHVGHCGLFITLMRVPAEMNDLRKKGRCARRFPFVVGSPPRG